MPIVPRNESYSGGPMNDRSVAGSASILKLRNAYRTELTIPGSESVSVPSRSKSIVLYCMARLYVPRAFAQPWPGWDDASAARAAAP